MTTLGQSNDYEDIKEVSMPFGAHGGFMRVRLAPSDHPQDGSTSGTEETSDKVNDCALPK